MIDPGHPEMAFYGKPGFLYLFDIRYTPADRAHCNPLPGGRVQLRVHSQPGFASARVIYNDGELRSTAMTLRGADERLLYWEAIITPARPRFHYAFALCRGDSEKTVCYLGRGGVTSMVEARFELDLETRLPAVAPGWTKDAVVYQIFPDRFARAGNTGPASWDTGAPPSRRFYGGDLPGVAQKLDYLRDLGVTALYLNPIFTSPSNHRYDTEDFYHVDPRLGGDSALRALVAAAHERDMKIILDCSFNHCSPRFFAFRDVLERGAASPYRDWFFAELPLQAYARPHLIPEVMRGDPRFTDLLYRMEHLTAETGVPVIRRDDFGQFMDTSYACWYGIADMPKLNQDNPATREYFLDVATYWLRELDVDGWRMDVTQLVSDDFWRAFRQRCKAVKPDCVLIAEVWGDSAVWLQGDMFDGTMNYLLHALCTGYFANHTLSTRAFVDGLHRLLSRYAPAALATSLSLLSSHDVPRFLHECGGDTGRFLLAYFFVMTMPGTPCIYYGDEVGMTGGADPDNRRPFPWDERPGADVTAAMGGLIRLRQSSKALCRGDFRLVWHGPGGLAFVREYEDEQVLVMANRDSGPMSITVDLAAEKGAEIGAERLWGACDISVDGARITLANVPGMSGCCVRLAREPA